MQRSSIGSVAPALILAAAGLARAQCSWNIPDVPDLDQRRSFGGSHSGLPGNGSMYCVPTAFVNWFAYLANRGIPQPNTLDGPRDWQSNANYDRVTDVISFMGALMETDATEGTKGKAVSGAKSYASLMASGDLIISGESVWGGGGHAPTLESLQDLYKIGAYTAGTYGRYGASGGGQRNGGHAISFVGVWDTGCGSSPILQFRDPADASADTSQSDFRTSLAAMTEVTGQFQNTSGSQTRTLTMFRLDTTGPSDMFLDATYVILPMAAIFGGGGGDAGEIKLVRPFRPTGNPAPETLPYNKSAGTGDVLDVVMSSNPMIHYYITGQGSSQGPAVWRLNIRTGQSTRIISAGAVGIDPRRLAYGRLGDLYVINGEAVQRYDPSTTPATILGGISPTVAPDAIAYDDKNDTVVILSEVPPLGARRVQTVPRTLSGFGTNRELPATYSGEAYIQPDAETAGAIFVCSQGGGVLRRFEVQGGDLVQTDQILHLNGSLSGLNVTDANRLIYAVNGVLVEKEENAQGSWVNRPNSRWAGRVAEGSVSIARSRTNHLASEMEGPEFNNLANPPIFPALPACYANCDQSTISPVLNVQDFACFLNKFAAREVYANCDNSTTTPELNVQDFSCFLNKFAAGCS